MLGAIFDSLWQTTTIVLISPYINHSTDWFKPYTSSGNFLKTTDDLKTASDRQLTGNISSRAVKPGCEQPTQFAVLHSTGEER